MPEQRPLHICFVAPNAWPILAQDSATTFVGGAEVQQVRLARGLIRHGYRVSMICADHGQPAVTEVGGVRVVRCPRTGVGLPGVRFLHPWATGVWAALRSVDADVYYQRTASAVTGVVGLFARRHNKRFVYAAAHDLDLAKDRTVELFMRRAGWRDRQLFTLGLTLADEVIAQHAGQVADCRTWYGRTPVTVPSCYEKPAGARADRDGCVLWVSTLRPWKRPELFLDLARRLPHLRFRMVGGAGSEATGPELFARIKAGAESLPNVEFVGFVPHAHIEPHFDAARVFVNTSTNEGFPNTFLQAWSRGIPTVSFCDTASRVDGKPVTGVVRDFDEMTGTVRELMGNDEAWLAAGSRARRCADESHTLDAALDVYQQVFNRLCGIEPVSSITARKSAA